MTLCVKNGVVVLEQLWFEVALFSLKRLFECQVYLVWCVCILIS